MNVGKTCNELSTYFCMKNIYFLNIISISLSKPALNTISDLKSFISTQIMKKSPINEYNDLVDFFDVYICHGLLNPIFLYCFTLI